MENNGPAERRLAVVRLHADELHISSIARYLETSYQTVHTTLKRWVEEGARGLEDKSHAPKYPKRWAYTKSISLEDRLSTRDEFLFLKALLLTERYHMAVVN